MKFSKKYITFLVIAAFVFVINLLIMNEYTTIFEGVESNFLLDVQTLLGKNDNTTEIKALFPVWLSSIVYNFLDLNEFGLRVVNVFVLLLTFCGFYFFGKKIFGNRTTIIALLVLGSSFLPVNFAKVISGDIWLFSAQLMSFIFMILFLKQPINKWKWGVWIFTVFGALIHPLSMFIWSIGFWGYLQIIHPKRDNLKGLILLPLLLVVYGPLYYFGYVSLEMPHFFMGIGSDNFKYYFVIALLGILPWSGFLPASIWDMIQKFRKKEEMAIINMGWILFAVFSQSLLIVAAFSFIISKNLQSYFSKNYPYRRLVKGFSLLHLIFAFIVLFSVLTGGFIQFQGAGYRSVLGVSSIYWMASMAAVMGLWLMNNSIITGGMAASGLMASWLFWLQVNPLVESQRNLPKVVFHQLKTIGVGTGVEKTTELYHLSSDSIFYQQNFKVYLNELNVQPIPTDSVSMISIPSKFQKAFAAIPNRFYEKLPPGHVFLPNNKYEITGGKGLLEEVEKYQIIEF